MKLRTIIFVAVGLAFGSGQVMAQAARFNANAGTGPYDFGPLTGLTNIGRKELIADYIIKNINTRNVTASEGSFNRAILPVRRSLNIVFEGQSQFLESFESSVSKCLQKIASKDLKGIEEVLIDLESRIRNQRESVVGLRTMKSGVFLRDDSTYQFNSLIASSLEKGSGKHKYATYATGGLFFPLNSNFGNVTSKIGLGFAYGDPSHFIGTGNIGTYLSPGALDLSASLSYSLRTKTNDDNDKDNDSTLRNVMDHIRPGDVWLTFSGRQISGTTSSNILANGTIGEVELTFAGAEVHKNTTASKTFSISGIYCAKKSLRIDELGAELRIPIDFAIPKVKPGPNFEQPYPTFLCFRYGTRGQYTLSLNWKF